MELTTKKESQKYSDHELACALADRAKQYSRDKNQPSPTNPEDFTPEYIAWVVTESLLAPEQSDTPQNQALYSQLRKVARQCALSLCQEHRIELLQMIKGRKLDVS